MKIACLILASSLITAQSQADGWFYRVKSDSVSKSHSWIKNPKRTPTDDVNDAKSELYQALQAECRNAGGTPAVSLCVTEVAYSDFVKFNISASTVTGKMYCRVSKDSVWGITKFFQDWGSPNGENFSYCRERYSE